MSTPIIVGDTIVSIVPPGGRFRARIAGVNMSGISMRRHLWKQDSSQTYRIVTDPFISRYFLTTQSVHVLVTHF